MAIGNRLKKRKQRPLSDRQDSDINMQSIEGGEESAESKNPSDMEEPIVLEEAAYRKPESEKQINPESAPQRDMGQKTREQVQNGPKMGKAESSVRDMGSRHAVSDSHAKNAGTAVLIGMVLDATYSITTAYPAVFVILREFLERMTTKSREYPGVTFLYSLTILHDEPSLIMFDSGPFTKNAKEMEGELRKLFLYGGSEDGREDLNAAVRMQLSALNKYDYKANGFVKAHHGLLLFTDSMPQEGEEKPDFSGDILEDGIANHGLRFAQIYSYDANYFPVMRMVDTDGEKSQEQKNYASYGSIVDFLDGGREEAIEQIEEIVKTILSQTSIGV